MISEVQNVFANAFKPLVAPTLKRAALREQYLRP